MYVANTFKCMTPYLKGLHPTICGWREGRGKDIYKIKSQPRDHLKVWEQEHENWLEEKELEVLRLNKDETSPEWLYPDPRLREGVLEVTRCRASGSMTAFYLLGYKSGQGFGSGLWDHEELRYDSENWSTQWKN